MVDSSVRIFFQPEDVKQEAEPGEGKEDEKDSISGSEPGEPKKEENGGDNHTGEVKEEQQQQQGSTEELNGKKEEHWIWRYTSAMSSV